MSLVLGPIHYWMYAKIRLAKARERAIFLAFYQRYGREAEEASGRSKAEYDRWFEDDRLLEKLVENAPVHAWLQGQIDATERSEAEMSPNRLVNLHHTCLHF